MNPKIILLVEDNPSDIGLTHRALMKNQIASVLVVVEDGQEALDYLLGTIAPDGRDVQPLPALVLLDIKLPKVDGIEVLRRIRNNQRTRRLPVAMFTTSLEEQEIAACYDLGANSFIRKPVDFEQFARAIQQLDHYWLVLNEIPPKVRA